MIVKISEGKYKIKSHKTGKMYPKVYTSKEAAQKRINQMERFKHINKSVSYVIIEKAKGYTRTKRGKLEFVKPYQGKTVEGNIIPKGYQRSNTDAFGNQEPGAVYYLKHFSSEKEATNAWQKYKAVGNISSELTGPQRSAPHIKDFIHVIGVKEDIKNNYGMQAVPTENKKPNPIADKKSGPGDGFKSLTAYKTVWELGQAIDQELQKIPRPPGFGGFAVGFEQNSKSMVISFDEPRELRHPEDYRMPEYETSNARDNYRKLSEAVDKVVKKLEDMKVRVVVAFDSSDVKNWITGKPKESEYVK